ncbi:MAG: hypothetical protein OEY10_05830, partial [Nitrosopumilus sp.]|nr:hypothetical protein [Nitrosopumilus sp.]
SEKNTKFSAIYQTSTVFYCNNPLRDYNFLLLTKVYDSTKAERHQISLQQSEMNKSTVNRHQ